MARMTGHRFPVWGLVAGGWRCAGRDACLLARVRPAIGEQKCCTMRYNRN